MAITTMMCEDGMGFNPITNLHTMHSLLDLHRRYNASESRADLCNIDKHTENTPLNVPTPKFSRLLRYTTIQFL